MQKAFISVSIALPPPPPRCDENTEFAVCILAFIARRFLEESTIARRRHRCHPPLNHFLIFSLLFLLLSLSLRLAISFFTRLYLTQCAAPLNKKWAEFYDFFSFIVFLLLILSFRNIIRSLVVWTFQSWYLLLLLLFYNTHKYIILCNICMCRVCVSVCLCANVWNGRIEKYIIIFVWAEWNVVSVCIFDGKHKKTTARTAYADKHTVVYTSSSTSPHSTHTHTPTSRIYWI